MALGTAGLTPFSYVMLALIGDGGAGPHDLRGMMRRGRAVYAAAESKYYSEPKRLEQLGYLRSHKEPGRTHPRTVYRLTRKGRAALLRWLRQPTPFPRMQNEAIVRVMCGDMVGNAAIVKSLQGLRREVEEISALIEEGEQVAATLPHRERYLRLNYSLLRRLVGAFDEWISEVERELGRK